MSKSNKSTKGQAKKQAKKESSKHNIENVKNNKNNKNNKASKASSTSRSSAKNVAVTGVFIALAMVFSYIETFIPINIGVPGVKLGLANIVTIVVLHKLGVGRAVLVSNIRIVLSAMLFGNMTVMLYSLAGAMVSLLVMTVLCKLKFFSIAGVSIAGGVAHNMGQLVLAMFMLSDQHVLYYAPVLIISGTIAGIVTGILAVAITYRVNIDN